MRLVRMMFSPMEREKKDGWRRYGVRSGYQFCVTTGLNQKNERECNRCQKDQKWENEKNVIAMPDDDEAVQQENILEPS